MQPHERDRIAPWDVNPRFWQLDGRPTVLLGGSVEDNLFQVPSLEEHLDLLVSVGGNYVRNTMSARDPGDVQPHRLCADGLHDLDEWNDEYWTRLTRFLELTAERKIIAQFELWDRFDFAREPWQQNSFNPRLNRNYTTKESTLAEEIHTHPGKNESRWFFSIPDCDNNELLLAYQKAYIDKLLSYSLDYPNVLYCMDNETEAVPEWGAFWAEYVKGKAGEKGVSVQTTEMWDSWELDNPAHERTWRHPEIYSFCDVSQNNHHQGQVHWDKLQTFRRCVDPVRPINTVKTYGADGGKFQGTAEGKARLWRSIFGGCASARHHRPSAGLGLNEEAQASIRSLRMVVDAMNWFEADSHNELLSQRPEDGSYCHASIGREYAVYFPRGEGVTIDLAAAPGKMTIRWLDIGASQWRGGARVSGKARLTPPSQAPWAAAIS